METTGPQARPMEHFTLAQLERLMDSADTEVANAKATKEAVQAELAARYAPAFAAAMDQVGRHTAGSTAYTPEGTFDIKGERKKTVKWDSTKLMTVAQGLPWDRVSAIFKITFEVGEKIYDGIKAADPDLAKKLDDARTVKISPPAISLKRVEG
jgi:hypothetical protein